MAEIDVFERSLADAFLRLADDVPGAVDADVVAHRVAFEHPRRRTSVLGWRPAAVSRLAWVLLLLAVLLAALVAGALLVGSQPQRGLPAMLPPIGQVYACPPGSTPDEPGPVDQAGPSEADMGTAFDIAFDRRAGRLVAVTSAGGAVATWAFDVCTNAWNQMHPKGQPPGFGWAELVYDIDSDVTILVANEPDRSVARVNVWAYDLQADTWTEKGVAPTDDVVSLAYDPVSGLVVTAERYADPGPSRSDRTLMWTYDVETDTWTPIQLVNAGPSEGAVFAYDASVDRMVAYTSTYNGYELVPETWLLDLRTGTWSRSSAQTPEVRRGLGLPNIEYDEAARRAVVMAWAAAAYDAPANRWEMLVAYSLLREGGMPTATMVYDPVNERLVGPGPHYNADGVHVDRAAVFAFDPGTREWTVLLEPGIGQPANMPPTAPAPTSARTPTPSGGPEASGIPSPVPTAAPTSTPKPTTTP
jgi:hypothetical protein